MKHRNAIKELYEVIFSRRDIRSQFSGQTIPEQLLAKILKAAHSAPSVGFMQPWNFLLIRNQEIKGKVFQAFQEGFEKEAGKFEAERQKQYRKLKLEGILDAPINICVTCDRSRTGPVVLGRTLNQDMDLYSTVCAVQNLWLAARAEGIGVGWVSIFEYDKLHELLQLPAEVEPIAYLCVGFVEDFPQKPELETLKWSAKQDLKNLVFSNSWGESIDSEWPALAKALMKKFEDL